MSGPVLNSRLFRLAAKELREALRDRRTVLTLVVMPVLLYPLLSLGFQRFLLAQSAPAGEEYRIGILRSAHPLIQHLIAFADEVQTVDMAAGREPPPTFELVPVEDLEEAVQRREVDLGLRVLHYVPPRSLLEEMKIDCEIVAPDVSIPTRAERFLRERFRAAGMSMLVHRMQDLGVTQRMLPIQTRVRLVTVSDVRSGPSLASLVPIVLVLMTITGAVYPAIDLTAGERERNTLELLMAAPVPRFQLLLAKYAAVVTVAFFTAGLNLASMFITLQASGMGPLVWGEKGLSLAAAMLVLLLLALFAAFFSAVLLCITSFARSFKEAQAYLVPVMLVSMSPGLLTLLPDIHLQGWIPVVPLMNVTLLARDLLAGRADPVAAGAVVATTVVYGVGALLAASKIFGADAVLYDARGGWSELLERPGDMRPAPSLSTALGSLMVLFPLAFLGLGFAGQQTDWSIGRRLFVNSTLAGVLFALVPGLLAYWQRVSFVRAFSLRPPGVLSVLGGLLLGLSLWPFAHELLVLSVQVGLVSLGKAQLERANFLASQLREIPVLQVLMALAVVPAVTEEWLFRGFVFSALKERWPPVRAIVAAGLLFGLFHLIAVEGLAIERFLPTTFLGLVLAWVCWRTGSLFPGILLHVLHNGVYLLAAYYEGPLSRMSWFPEQLLKDQELGAHLPAGWLGMALAGVLAGVTLVQLGGRRPEDSRVGSE